MLQLTKSLIYFTYLSLTGSRVDIYPVIYTHQFVVLKLHAWNVIVL
jgi:hypothetical protein